MWTAIGMGWDGAAAAAGDDCDCVTVPREITGSRARVDWKTKDDVVGGGWT